MPRKKTVSLNVLEGNSIERMGIIPAGCLGISWCKRFNSILLSNNKESKVLNMSKDGEISTLIGTSIISPRGICFDEKKSVIHIEQGMGDSLIKTIDCHGTLLSNLINKLDSKEYKPVSTTVGLPSLRTNGMCFSKDGSLWSVYDNSIISISSSGVVTKEIGDGRGFSIGSDITKIAMNHPGGITCNRKGDVYVSDTGNHVVREFIGGKKQGRTIGSPTESGHKDGSATVCRFSTPTDMTCHSDSIYTIDAGTMIKKIDTSTMNVSTLFHSKGRIDSLTCDNKGRIYFTEILNGS